MWILREQALPREPELLVLLQHEVRTWLILRRHAWLFYRLISKALAIMVRECGRDVCQGWRAGRRGRWQ